MKLKEAVKNLINHKDLQYVYKKYGRSYCRFCGALRYVNYDTDEWFEQPCAPKCPWRYLREAYDREIK